MIVRCEGCPMFYDDEYRSTLCPHDTFAANDGHNRFAHHPLSYLSSATPSNVGHDGPTRPQPVTPKAQHPSGDVERVVREHVSAYYGHSRPWCQDVTCRSCRLAEHMAQELTAALAALRVAPAASVLVACTCGADDTIEPHANGCAITRARRATPPAAPGPGR